MYKWKTSTNLKKIQRSVNKTIRYLNESLEKDELWKGRFYAHQLERRVYREPDALYVKFLFEFVDRQTGKFAYYWFNEIDLNGISTWRLWERMNSFIVDYVNAWAESPRPNRATSIDYRKGKRK